MAKEVIIFGEGIFLYGCKITVRDDEGIVPYKNDFNNVKRLLNIGFYTVKKITVGDDEGIVPYKNNFNNVKKGY